MDENLLKETEDNISQNLKGWVSREEFEEAIPDRVSAWDSNEIKEFVNDRDKINIRSTGSTATKSTYFIEHKTDQPYKQYKENIPADTHEIFDKWVGMGRSPRVIVALITYLTSEDEKVISNIADEHECCTASITNNKPEMIEDLKEEDLEVKD